MTVKVGLVGAGVMGSLYARVLAATDGAQVVGIAGGSSGRAAALVESTPGAILYSRWQDMLDDADLDLVCITTPDHLHAEIIVAAADAGVHVACEKPLTTDLVSGRMAVEAVRRNGVKGMTLFNHRWIPAYAQARQLIADGAIGSPVVSNVRKNDRIFVPTEMIGWADKTTPAWFLSSHDIDLLCWLHDDRITSVTAQGHRGVLQRQGVDTYDAIQIQAMFSGGSMATIESCWIYPNTFPTMVDSYLQVVGSDGVLQLDRQQEQITAATADGYQFPRNTISVDVHGTIAGAAPLALLHVVDAVAADREPLVTLESSLHVTEVLQAAHRSIVSGRPESVGTV